MQAEGGARPCKYGDNCHNWRNGSCIFFHPYPPPGNQNQGGRGQQFSGGQGGRGNGRGRGGYGGYGNSGQGGKQGNGQGGRGYGGGSSGYSSQNNHNQNHNPNHNQNQHQNQDPIVNEFCRFYQVGQCTRNGCKKIHGFLKDNSLHRISFMRSLPSNEVGNIGSFFWNEKNFFSIRMGNDISFYEYNPENSQLNDMNISWKLPESQCPYHYYENNENYLYFAYENSTTHFVDLGFYDILNQKVQVVENAHQKNVTGIIHFNSSLMLSSSIDGTIKVWKNEGDKLTLEKSATEMLEKCFNNGNKTEILFLQFKKFGQNTLLTAGTADNRLLFWSGAEMSYKQLVFSSPYVKVLKIHYVNFNSAWIGFAIVWNCENNICGIIAIDLATLNFSAVVHIDAPHPKYLFSDLASIGKFLLVSTVQGIVNIYQIPNFNEKVGVIMHQNSIANMISLSSMTSTNIPIKNLFILEKMMNKKEGSFAIYTLKQ